MKLYILRHEDRTADCSFFSPLTEEGLLNSEKLSNLLNKLKIDIIFSSPYIRTLQTIYPFVLNNKIKVNLEYSLCEIQHQSIIAEKSSNISLPLYIAKHFNYNEEYKSFLNYDQLKYPEKEEDVHSRIYKFTNNILMNYINTNKNILIVSHQTPCKILLSPFKKSINKDLLDNYNKGYLTQIFNDDKWELKPMNYKLSINK
jgi:broad specificity phosphatase PhoE